MRRLAFLWLEAGLCLGAVGAGARLGAMGERVRVVGCSGLGPARLGAMGARVRVVGGSGSGFGVGARSGSGSAGGTLAKSPRQSLSLSLEFVRQRVVRLGRGRGEGLVADSLSESGGPWIHTSSSTGSKPGSSASFP